MEIQHERKSDDSVKLWVDRDYFVIVHRESYLWEVTRFRGDAGDFEDITAFNLGLSLGEFNSAQEAVDYAQNYLQDGNEELTEALRNL